MPVIVKRGDTHDIFFRLIDDATKGPIDLTGATPEIHVQLKKDPPIDLAAVIDGDPTLGRVKHTLTGTLAVGTYALEVQVTKGGVITTVPTVGTETLIVAQDIAD